MANRPAAVALLALTLTVVAEALLCPPPASPGLHAAVRSAAPVAPRRSLSRRTMMMMSADDEANRGKKEDSQRVRLREEAERPFSKLRFALYAAAAGSGAIGSVFASARLVGESDCWITATTGPNQHSATTYSMKRPSRMLT